MNKEQLEKLKFIKILCYTLSKDLDIEENDPLLKEDIDNFMGLCEEHINDFNLKEYFKENPPE